MATSEAATSDEEPHMYISAEASERIHRAGPRCVECNQPGDPDSVTPDGRAFCWGCYPVAGHTPEGTATEDVLVAPPNAKVVGPAIDILLEAGLPDGLVARMRTTVSATADRCYQHPESPSGYVGRGRWCEHRAGRTVTAGEL